jgi:hypothetical protein
LKKGRSDRGARPNLSKENAMNTPCRRLWAVGLTLLSAAMSARAEEPGGHRRQSDRQERRPDASVTAAGKLSAVELTRKVLADRGWAGEHHLDIRRLFQARIDDLDAGKRKQIITLLADEIAVLQRGKHAKSRGTLHDRSYLLRFLGDLGARQELAEILKRHYGADCCAAPAMIEAFVSCARKQDAWLLVGKFESMGYGDTFHTLHSGLAALTSLDVEVPETGGRFAGARGWAEALALAGIGRMGLLYVPFDGVTEQVALMRLKEGILRYELGQVKTDGDAKHLPVWTFLPAGRDKWVKLDIAAAMGHVHQATLSPDRKHLVLVTVGEGHPVLEVFDWPALLDKRRGESRHYIDPYPGGVQVNDWAGRKLRIESDMPLARPRNKAGRVNARDTSDATRDFLLDPTTGCVTKLSDPT